MPGSEEIVAALLWRAGSTVTEYLASKVHGAFSATPPAAPMNQQQSLAAVAASLQSIAQSLDGVAHRDQAVAINHSGPVFQVRSNEVVE